jgi:XTP/dITP diphosphohydrolase
MSRKLEEGSRLVVASHNMGKVWEINQLFAPYGLAAVSAGELGLTEPAETETTFEGNALIKALAAAEGSGLPALADDSGLEIDALDGAPGVVSADWAGPGRDFGLAMRRVHDELEAAGAWKKKKKPPKANFISVLCLAWPDGKHKFFEGRVKGHIVWPARGGNGFGYDPIFVPKGHDETFGEMEPAAKQAMSHRARAFAKFEEKCLGHLERREPAAAASETASTAASGLAAAAANISTKDELAAFVANLAAKLEKESKEDVQRFLEALRVGLAVHNAQNEPPWRTIAKSLLSASSRRP